MKRLFLLLYCGLATICTQAQSSDKEVAEMQNTLFVINEEDYTDCLLGLDASKFADVYVIKESNAVHDIHFKTKEGDSIHIRKNPFTINGQTYKSLCRITTKAPIKLMTLEEVRKKYCPEAKGSFLYMIDYFVILAETEHLKVDADFIDRVDIIPSSEVRSLKPGKDAAFSIVRLFTKNPKKIEKPVMRLR